VSAQVFWSRCEGLGRSRWLWH